MLEELKKYQKEKDDRAAEKHEKEIELMDAQIKSANEPKAVPGSTANKSGNGDDKKGHSYKDPLEQKQHEKVGEGKKQGVQKAQAKAK